LLSDLTAGCALRQSVKTVVAGRKFGYSRNDAVERSRYKLIDNFASRDFKNQVGGNWATQVSTGSSLKAEYKEEEAIDHYGYALALKYSLKKGGKASLYTDLNGLDISKAQALSIWFAYTAHNDPTFRIKLMARGGGSREVEVTDRLSPGSKGWQQLVIPISKWKGIDLNQLERFEFIVESPKGEDGSFLVDQIAFYGPENVFFESLKDNLLGFPKNIDSDRSRLLGLQDQELLKRIAKDTWGYFANMVDRRTQLPLDRIKLSWEKEIGDYTSPTDIGLYFLSVVCAGQLGFISKTDAAARINRSLKTVERLPKWKGFLYNYYSTTNLKVTTQFVSTVDNGWFVAALMVLKAVFPGAPLAARADSLIKQMDFYELYDMGEGKFVLGYDDRAKKFSNNHYGLLVSEARITSVVAIAKGDVEPEHWFRLHRVPPREWKWQTQIPQGTFKNYHGIRFLEGYYIYDGKQIVPSWGGSLFEFLMPSMVLDEPRLAVESCWKNNRVAAETHRDYALLKKRYPVWGISPCMVDRAAHGNYLELGIKEIGVKGYSDKGVIAPYASLLALEILPEDVLMNLRRLLNLYPIYGEYGFYDSVWVRKPLVTKQYLALDQAMILIAITNYLKSGIIRKKFHSLKEVRKIEPLLSEEKFFEN